MSKKKENQNNITFDVTFDVGEQRLLLSSFKRSRTSIVTQCRTPGPCTDSLRLPYPNLLSLFRSQSVPRNRPVFCVTSSDPLRVSFPTGPTGRILLDPPVGTKSPLGPSLKFESYRAPKVLCQGVCLRVSELFPGVIRHPC